MTDAQTRLRRAVLTVAILNAGYFFVEFSIARAIGSVSLFADSIDFLEDASVNFLVLVSLGWSMRRRATVGMLLALLLLVPGIATAWMAWSKLAQPVPPAEWPLTLGGLGALLVNVTCAFLLVKVSHVAGSLSRAAFLSARNDAYANVAILTAAGITALWPSAWPDLLVGLGILVLNLGAAHEVYEASRQESRAARGSLREML
jgi:Co/Zn/Cd efflux system component